MKKFYQVIVGDNLTTLNFEKMHEAVAYIMENAWSMVDENNLPPDPGPRRPVRFPIIEMFSFNHLNGFTATIKDDGKLIGKVEVREIHMETVYNNRFR